MKTMNGLTASYTIHFKEYDQDNLNFFDFTKNDRNELDDIFDYDKILKRSIKEGLIENENDIRCFVDGSDHQEPYFTSNTADEEYNTYEEEE